MVSFDSLNSHFEYMDVIRHWSPISEKYAGGDTLITLLNQGWQITDKIHFEEFWHSGTRPVTIYYMDLMREGATLHLPVLTNPYVRRLIGSLSIQVRPVQTRSVSPEH
jgi:hypothetical protein